MLQKQPILLYSLEVDTVFMDLLGYGVAEGSLSCCSPCFHSQKSLSCLKKKQINSVNLNKLHVYNTVIVTKQQLLDFTLN